MKSGYGIINAIPILVLSGCTSKSLTMVSMNSSTLGNRSDRIDPDESITKTTSAVPLQPVRRKDVINLYITYNIHY